MVRVRERETVGTIVEKLKGAAGVRLLSLHVPLGVLRIDELLTGTQLSPSTRIKIVYGGRPYHDHDTLGANSFWNFANAHTLVALVLDEGRN
jgi:hypothetical protein